MGDIKKTVVAAALAAGTLGAGSAWAIEGNGLPIYPDGLENYMSGALPPPGVHALIYGGAMRYDSVRDRHGDKLPIPDFKVDVGVIAPRLVWVTGQQVLGGQLAFHALAPLLTVKAQAAGQSQRRSGLGDVVFGPALGFHPSEKLHYILGVDFVAPTGRYDVKDSANLGRNYWAIQPAAALSYIQPSGLNVDLKVMVDFNMRNRDTDTRTGHAIHADYAVGWGLGNGFVLGVGGYAYQQVQSDRGPMAGDSRARAFAIGPSLRYANDKGLLITAKYQQDLGVRGRPEGKQFFVKVAVPF
ncbi:SphA family protein [Alcaligenes sp. SDU_A2]|uniref:SphA family protein n=1 Tax=Alcaligenes sp. SDU_A2 TaxID=3136634 RepID=UPI002C22356B|nr:transporter [Alcaligenes sp.]HRL26442.1 transporter [Alcaligenes sp.]